MRIKATVLLMAAGLVLMLSPMVSLAQSSGQFAVAQPHPAFLPTQAPAIAMRAPFGRFPAGSAPIIIVQPQAPVEQNPFFSGGPFFPTTQTVVSNPVFAPTQVFAPNPVFAPNTVFAPTQAVNPSQFVLPMAPTQLLLPGQTVFPATTSQLPMTTVQAGSAFRSTTAQQTTAAQPATSRADLLWQFGDPVVTVMTSTSETLYFRDGTKVTLQNGQVIGSK